MVNENGWYSFPTKRPYIMSNTWKLRQNNGPFSDGIPKSVFLFTLLYFDSNLTLPLGPTSNTTMLVWITCFAPNVHQTITWTSAGLVHRRIYAPLSLDKSKANYVYIYIYIFIYCALLKHSMAIISPLSMKFETNHNYVLNTRYPYAVHLYFYRKT